PDISGTVRFGRTCMAQNYLKADLPPDARDVSVPLAGDSISGPRICYDGQMGNTHDILGAKGLAAGPFAEERILLHLYENKGPAMFSEITDAVFAVVISDGENLLAARDLLGIKTLFYGWKEGTLYLSSELKSLLAVTNDVNEFPPGHYMDGTGKLNRFAELPPKAAQFLEADPQEVAAEIRNIIRRSLRSRIDFSHPTGSLLSGGIDSSVIACLATELYREKFGPDARLKTFALGVGESRDLKNARIMADHIGSEHCEVIVDLNDLLDKLPEVIYHLESFDPSLVRSSVANFIISGRARAQGIEILLSGEGGDEVFCGYTYLKQFPPEEMHARQMECIGFLHNNASLRLDRMNHCNSLRVVAPLISGELLNYSISLPPGYKQREENGEKIEKWIFRKAFEDVIPNEIAWRPKQEFSQGSGSADVLPRYFEEQITDGELAEAQARYPMIRSKEELHYFKIFTSHFGLQVSGEELKKITSRICCGTWSTGDRMRKGCTSPLTVPVSSVIGA
ncbi:MAG: asparagine synthase-related protein, partial [Deltaproteobacteria bacterium]